MPKKPSHYNREGIVEDYIIKVAPFTKNLLFMIPVVCFSAVFVSLCCLSLVFVARNHVQNKSKGDTDEDDDKFATDGKDSGDEYSLQFEKIKEVFSHALKPIISCFKGQSYLEFIFF